MEHTETQSGNHETGDVDNVKIDIKQKLSAHVHCRMLNSAAENHNSGEPGHETSDTVAEPMLTTTHIKTESGIVEAEVRPPAVTAGDVEVAVGGAQTSNTTGSFMAGSVVLSNSILDEVLNEKKLALLQSFEVVKFLQETCKHTSK